MDRIELDSRAKLNFTLNVLDKREDGYHNLESVFQRVSLSDKLVIEKNNDNEFKLITNVDEISNENNIIYKVYVKLNDKYNIGGVTVTLDKNIPMQAGMGGGSANAASFILGINEMFNLNMSDEEIHDIAVSIGADVVPCLYDGTFLAKGIGDIIELIDSDYVCHFVVIKPKFSFSTKDMFNKIDSRTKKIDKDSTNVINGLINNDLDMIVNNLYNDFELVSGYEKDIDDIKNDLISSNAKGALLTGSGSCIYGIYDSLEEAQKAYDNLNSKYEVYLCHSVNRD